MKQQPSATTKRPSRLCRLLLVLVGCKALLLGTVLFEPLFDFGSSSSNVVATWKAPTVAENAVPAQAVQAAHGAAVPEEPVTQAVAVAAPGVPQPSQSAAPVEIQQPRTRGGSGVAFAAVQANPSRQATPQSNLSLEALNRKQEELARKEQDLRNLQAELDARFEQMRELEQRLQIMLKDAEEMKDARYRHLVDVLSNMKARQAADVLATLDEKVAVRVLAGMRGRQAGEILSFVDSAKAARLTEALTRMQMPLE